jgi:hypothetical protein
MSIAYRHESCRWGKGTSAASEPLTLQQRPGVALSLKTKAYASDGQ